MTLEEFGETVAEEWPLTTHPIIRNPQVGHEDAVVIKSQQRSANPSSIVTEVDVVGRDGAGAPVGGVGGLSSGDSAGDVGFLLGAGAGTRAGGTAGVGDGAGGGGDGGGVAGGADTTGGGAAVGLVVGAGVVGGAGFEVGGAGVAVGKVAEEKQIKTKYLGGGREKAVGSSEMVSCGVVFQNGNRILTMGL
ncbi:glycine-rich protein 23-like [Camellia sinensis]|uniref:glycine-rich protein 23-like n=1 Tax=Camellia sinensis TaxID=4442 RepID=UPI001035F5E5|nr:glycine-rich protein 23-like [Camellia sinensis]